MFFTETICDPQKTGLIGIELFVYTKKSSSLASDFAEKGVFAQNFHKVVAENLLISNGVNANATIDVPSGHKSTNDLFLAITLNDHTAADSTFYKQRSTPYSAQQILNILNGKVIEEEFIFFKNFNVIRGSTANQYFTSDMVSPVQMRLETLRSMNALSVYDTTVDGAFSNMLNFISKYAFIRVNLEAYSTEFATDRDVLFDGNYSEL